MKKHELLDQLKEKIQSGEITPDEIIPLIKQAGIPATTTTEHKKPFLTLSRLLYIIGAIIATAGILIFIGIIWPDLGAVGHITITLGLGLLLAAIGAVQYTTSPQNNIGTVFQAIAGILIPYGTVITLAEFRPETVSAAPIAITFAIITAFYITLTLIYRKPVLTLFTVLNATIFMYLFTTTLLENIRGQTENIYIYLTMAIAVSYLLLAYTFRTNENKPLVGLFHLLGITELYAMSMYMVTQYNTWQLLFFFILIAGFFLSTFLRSRAILIMSAIFFIIHIEYITSKYFADSLGWPTTLILLGFIIISLGYASLTINKKFIR